MIGELESSEPFVAAVTAMTGDRNSEALLATIAKGRASGAKVAVLATDNRLGELQTPNRKPTIESGLPTVLVPGRYAESLKKGRVEVRFRAKTLPASSENIIGTFGRAYRPA